MPTRAVRAPSADDVARAAAIVGSVLPPTPLVTAEDGPLLKVETVQPTGSFKVRGALAALSRLDAGVSAVTASAGNHGLGVAWAAARLGVPATIVVPTTASPAKVEALRSFGSRLVLEGADYDGAEQRALRLADAGATYVSAYNDPDVIAGQASIGAELDAQLGPGPLTVVCGVGGGGLCSGLAVWAAHRPGTRVLGVEAARSRALSAAAREGRVVEVPVGATLADGLAGNLEPGSITPQLIAGGPVELVAVEEEALIAGVRHAALRWGLVLEGAAAAPVAAWMQGLVPSGNRAVLVLTGRNISAVRLSSILAG